MTGKHGVSVGLWVAAAALITLASVRGGPWLWARVFPPPGPGERPTVEEGDPLTPELVAEVVHRTISTLGTPDPDVAEGLQLPRGASPRELQDALRLQPRLAGAEVYVTRVDDLAWRLRVLRSSEVLLRSDVRPWLPDRPVVSASDPPELGVVIVFREPDEAALRSVGAWESPLAIGLAPFAAHTVKSARQAAWSSKGVVVVLDPNEDLREQLAAAPPASAALLEGDLPADALGVLLRALAERDVALVDGRPIPPASMERAAADAGVRYLRRAAHLSGPDSQVVALNLAVRRGHGLVTADADEQGLDAAEEFITSARADGYSLVFPGEVARIHGSGGGSGRAPPSP